MLTFHEPVYIGLSKIISGGQHGADLGGLVAGAAFNIETGGKAPAGFKTCQGNNSELGTIYGLTEDAHATYASRTQENVKNSDATLIIGTDLMSPGSRTTIKHAVKLRKPYFPIQLSGKPLPPFEVDNYSQAIANWLRGKNVSVLNVAGNRDYAPDNYHFDSTYRIMVNTLFILQLDGHLDRGVLK